VILAVDASALVAIALAEPEADEVAACLQGATEAYVTPVNLLEAGLAVVLRRGRMTAPQFSNWVGAQNVEPFDVDGFAAMAAYLAYGKGVHRAGLNLGDCFAYALAKQLGAALLYKGDAFAMTDIRSALQPT